MKNLILATMWLGMAATGLSAESSSPAEAGPSGGTPGISPAEEGAADIGESVEAATDTIAKKASELGQRAEDLSNTPEGQELAGTFVTWIESIGDLYQPWINWVLVMVGVALFISHAGQLVIGKLWGVVRGRFNFWEVINDLFVFAFAGLALPAVLFIEAGHGPFVGNPFLVLSSVAVGGILGIILFHHGVTQEAMAAKGEKLEKEREKRDD